MQNLYTTGDYVILAYKYPIVNAKAFVNFTDSLIDEGTGTIIKKEFRYSFDSETFSEYNLLESSTLEQISLEALTQVWFEFRYTLMSGGPIRVSSVSLEYTSYPSPASDIGADQLNIQNDNFAYPISYKEGARWEPYRLQKAVRLYKDLNLMVNSLFGHEVEYYRVLPKGRSKDVFLMEYSLFEHEDKKCMKVVVPDNQFPDNKLNMGIFGPEYEMPFEIQVDKEYFQTIFGKSAAPQKRDVIRFPRTNRIYKVSSAYLFRDFMNEPLYFKVTLIKWNPSSTVEQNEEMNALEEMTTSVDKLFGREQREEQIDTANPVQFNPPTLISDEVREYLSPLSEIIESPFINYYLTVAEYYYNLSKTINDKTFTIALSKEIISSLRIDKVYFIRSLNDIIKTPAYPDLEQTRYSIRKIRFIGINSDSKALFEMSTGESIYASQFTNDQIFSQDSIFEVFPEEYPNIDSPIFVCKDYDAYSLPIEVVKYSAINKFPENEDRSFSAWVTFKENSNRIENLTSFSFDDVTQEATLTFLRKQQFLKGQYVQVRRRSTSNFSLVGEISEVIDENSIKIVIDIEVSSYLQIVFGNAWKKYTDLTMQLSYPYVFIDSFKDSKGIRIYSLDKRHFIVTTNNQKTFFSLPNTQDNLSDDKWYGICVNISNLFKEMTFNIWETQRGTSDLGIVYSKTEKISPVDRSSEIPYRLFSSNMEITNIRVWKQKIESDKQSSVLNQNIVKDSSLALVIDNAIPISRLPYISYTH